jgi:hypothetical protein
VRGEFKNVKGTIALYQANLKGGKVDVDDRDREHQHQQREARQSPAQRRLLRRREEPDDHVRLEDRST